MTCSIPVGAALTRAHAHQAKQTIREAPMALCGCYGQHSAAKRSFPMTTLPQVARTMREILTTTADEAARTTRFVQRTSPLGGATFTQTLVFGFLGNPQASLEELTPTAATW